MRNKIASLLAALCLISALTAQAAPKPKPTPTPIPTPTPVPPPAAIPITGLPYTISAPGTYTLSADLPFTTPGGTALTINSSNVILDLGGHAITNFSAPSSTNPATGVYASAGRLSAVTVRNGTIAGFDTGIEIDGGTFIANTITISGITLNVFNADVAPPLGKYGIYFYFVKNSQVTNCIINNTEYAIIDDNGESANVYTNVKIQSSANPFLASNNSSNTFPTFNTLGNFTFQ